MITPSLMFDNDVRLVITIENKKPIELLDLTKALVSLANQFNNYVSKNGDSKEAREAKLYVKEIRSGSVILELMELANIGVLPFVENMNTILDFAGYIRKAYNARLGKADEPSPELTHNDLRDLSQIVNPVANDSGSQINISTTVNGNVELHLHIDSNEANAVQNIFQKELKALRAPEESDDTRSKVLLKWYQARNDMKSDTGNKGIIEDISSKPLNIIFHDDGLKDAMLHRDNPFTTVFVVDVKLQHVSGKLAAYKITKLHETFYIPDDDSQE
jgi:hypothetical protein